MDELQCCGSERRRDKKKFHTAAQVSALAEQWLGLLVDRVGFQEAHYAATVDRNRAPAIVAGVLSLDT